MNADQMRAGREPRKINEAEWQERAEEAEKRLQRQLDANTALHARAMLAESERDRFYGLWELEATRAVRAEGDNFLHAWDLAKVKVERDALKAALASIVVFHEEYGGALLGNTLAAAHRLLAPTPGVEESPE